MGRACADAVGSLREANSGAFKEFAPFLGPEPVVELLPYNFLPEWAEDRVGREALHELAIAGKMVHAQVRWLDKIADDLAPRSVLANVHGLNEALDNLARARFRSVLGEEKAAPFFAMFAQLYARYAASLAVDQASRGFRGGRLSLEQYVEHAKARAAPVRAPVDAVLLLIGTSEEQISEARSCFGWWAAGLQLYDDAIDVEEDFAAGRLSWVVSETLGALGAHDMVEDLEEDLFYETALVGGHLVRNLAAAESLFEKALCLAESDFPRCIDYLRATLRRTRQYRTDLEELMASVHGTEGHAPAG
ncbi:hypothetical protein SAMN00767673_2854 [Rubrobacter radiotolerans DSM 5868]|nr:hypothetical protein SAMN00767673_2854 [Rubrobacter radiotolerans DSM 5868]